MGDRRQLRAEVDQRCTAKACFLAGRRAPELACGAAEAIIDQVCDFSESDFIHVLAPLDATDRGRLVSDVIIAKSKLVLGFQIKYLGSVCTSFCCYFCLDSDIFYWLFLVIRMGLEIILSHMAPSCFSWSPYQAIWNHFQTKSFSPDQTMFILHLDWTSVAGRQAGQVGRIG